MSDPTSIPTIYKARSRLARLHTGNPHPDPELLRRAKQALTAAKLQRAIEAAVAAAPPLSDDQRSTLANLLTSRS